MPHSDPTVIPEIIRWFIGWAPLNRANELLAQENGPQFALDLLRQRDVSMPDVALMSGQASLTDAQHFAVDWLEGGYWPTDGELGDRLRDGIIAGIEDAVEYRRVPQVAVQQVEGLTEVAISHFLTTFESIIVISMPSPSSVTTDDAMAEGATV